MSYNIFEGAVGREEALLAVIRSVGPDLLFLQEVLDRASAAHLADALAMELCFAESNARTRNVALLSRLPLRHGESFHPFPLLRTLLLATVELPDGTPLHCFGVHLGLIHDLWRSYELAVILRRIRAYERAYPSPHALLAGDFNAVQPGERVALAGTSPLLRLVLALQFGVAPRLALRLVRRAGWVDCFRRCHPDNPGLTVPTPRPAVRLDYLFASPALAPHVTRCDVVRHPRTAEASDHFPVTLEIAEPP